METLVTSFLHENQSYPPYSSQYGNLRYTKKFDLIECLTKRITETSPPESCDVTVVDGAALVHALQMVSVSTFDEYAKAGYSYQLLPAR